MNITYRVDKKPAMMIPLLISLCFSLELLQYFNFSDGSLGVSVHVGRLFQVLVVPILLGVAIVGNRARIPAIVWRLMRLYILFIFSVGFFMIFSYFYGGYRSGNGVLQVKIRPLIEYFLYIYQFFVFVLIPVLLLRKYQDFYLFIYFIRKVLRFSLWAGVIDFLIRLLFNVDLISRTLQDGVDVGVRYHGFFGEPRDAAVVISFLFLIDLFYNRHVHRVYFIKKSDAFLYVVLIVLAQSMSAIVGIVFSVILLVMYFPRYVFMRNFKIFSVLIFFCILFGYLTFSFDRMQIYLDGLELGIISVINNDFSELPPVYSGQLPNLYPAAVFYDRLISADLLSFFIGSGLGSVAFINSGSGFWPGEFINPHSNALRLIIDFGLLGCWFYIFVHLHLLKGAKKVLRLDTLAQTSLMFVAVLIVGMSLSQRSPIIIMFVGVVLVAISVFSHQRMPAARLKAQITSGEK